MFQLRAFELAFAFALALTFALALALAPRLAFAFSLALSPPPHAVARASAAPAKAARSVFLFISSPVSPVSPVTGPHARARGFRSAWTKARWESRSLRWALIWGNLNAGGEGGQGESRGRGLGVRGW